MAIPSRKALPTWFSLYPASGLTAGPRVRSKHVRKHSVRNYVNAAAPQLLVAPHFLSDYRQGFLSVASLSGGDQSAGLGLEWHLEQVLVVIGKETFP